MSRRAPQTPLSILTVGALGVVYGDIGTSPLYAVRECFNAAGLTPSPENILGLLSLITWALILVVSCKYIWFVLRADNRGEGGILALTSLADNALASPARRRAVMFLGLAGAALFYGDTLITPAISVLGAVEGLGVAAPTLHHWIMPLSLTLIVFLFLIQRFGTGKVGAWFGPIMFLWFGLLAVFGLAEIFRTPEILHALNPLQGLTFLINRPVVGFITLGTVVLAITGAETLYTDLGHFGRQPIRIAWVFMVGPALLLNYYGQGALLLQVPATLENPFFLLVPDLFRLPMVILATMAAVIAAQAVISGAFSITNQAMQLGYLPRFEIRHTNAHHMGQVYLPALNFLLMVGVLLIMLSFGSSGALAGAYGIAVTGTMAITTLLATAVLYQRLGWKLWSVIAFGVVFLTIDLIFLTATLTKVPDGGWFPILLGASLLFVMHTWIAGRAVTHKQIYARTKPLKGFINTIPTLLKQGVSRPDRAAVYLTNNLSTTPMALTYNLEHNRVLHKQVVIARVARAGVPFVPSSQRLNVTHLGHGISQVEINYGFLEQPNVPAALNEASREHNLPFKPRADVSYFLSQHSYVPTRGIGLNRFQEPVYIVLEKLSLSAIRFFQLPRAQVVEIGDHIQI